MPNKYHNSDVVPHKQSGGEGASNAPQGSSPESPSKEGTAGWPGVPGKTQPRSRAGGAPTTGHRGHSFIVKKEGL